jgi:S1-C subfamily serine protease
MPMSETVGLTLEADHMARVGAVSADSPAARAGFRAGDDIIVLGGQPVISIADVSWVLHRAADSGSLTATVKRAGAEQTLTIPLPEQWRHHSDISRRVGTWTLRGMATGGMVLQDLSDEERAARSLPGNGLALFVKSVGQYGKHAAAKNAGFQKDDVLIELAGKSARLTEGELMGRLLQTTRPGEKLKAVVLRGRQRVELMLPMQ